MTLRPINKLFRIETVLIEKYQLYVLNIFLPGNRNVSNHFYNKKKRYLASKISAVFFLFFSELRPS